MIKSKKRSVNNKGTSKIVLILYLSIIGFVVLSLVALKEYNEKKVIGIEDGTPTSTCGNGLCESSREVNPESCSRCPSDCGLCTSINIITPQNWESLSALPESKATITGGSSNADKIYIISSFQPTQQEVCTVTIKNDIRYNCDSWGVTSTLLSGINQITAQACNIANQCSSSLIKLKYDNSNPTISITSHQNNQIITSLPITFIADANDDYNLTDIMIRINNGEWIKQECSTQNAHPHTTCSLSKQVSLVLGNNNIDVKATDWFNKINEATIQLIYAPLLPGVTLNFPSDNEFRNLQGQSVSFSCSASVNEGQISSLKLYGNWTTFGNLKEEGTFTCTGTTCSPISRTVKEGTYAWNCMACTSNACEFAPGNRTITVDKTKPQITFTSQTKPDKEKISEKSIFAQVSVIELNKANITFYLYNKTKLINVTNYTYNNLIQDNEVEKILFANLNDDNYTYTVNVTDKANNKDGVRRTIEIIPRPREPGAPLVDFIDPTPEDYVEQEEKSVYINISASDELNKIDKCWLSWNKINITMNNASSGLDISCYLNKSSLTTGEYSYKAYANNSIGKIGETEERRIIIKEEGINGCEEDWECAQWSSCLNNKKTRTCNDLSNCGTILDKPALEESCAPAPQVINFELNLDIPNLYKLVNVGESILSKIEVTTTTNEPLDINLKYIIEDEDEEIVLEKSETLKIKGNTIINKWLNTPDEEGTYKLRVSLSYQDAKEEAEDTFSVVKRIGEAEFNKDVLTITIVIIIIASLIVAGIIIRNLAEKEEKDSKEKNEDKKNK